ncbi:MAG: O-methyltransferase [Armatimonadota bacterium]|nr:O-methyltransferase [Armatimonadota bacterium]MDR7448268.1 O-methyltransferase [Armatimonadota bacterium]MDR7458298.1 O-methyltransferase [Armatimonadota bacterium]MDR7478399.1 O-methyltransferase [Armatimonadota bacterium]MDR7487333.1 O-methyltransferase [Armatimonadota bacterium]
MARMPDVLEARLNAYLDGLLPPRDPLLADLEAQAREERIPISGPHVGHLLAALIGATRPARALEVGTAIGYAAIWMGRALRETGGRLLTVELRESMAARARRNLAEAGLAEVVEVRVGAALDVLPQLDPGFGLIFLDAVKAEYPAYLEHALRLTTPGGLILADNALLGGEVIPGSGPGFWDEEAREGVRAYNARAFSDPALLSVILPLHDGVTLSLRR